MYRRRLARIFRDLAVGTQVLYHRAAVHQVRLRAQLSRLEPPASLRAEHAQLLGVLAEADRRWADSTLPAPARVRDAVGMLRQARSQRERLEKRAREVSGEGYGRALAELTKRSYRELDHAIAATEQAAIAAVGRLTRSRPPAGVAVFQWALVDAVGRHIAAMRSFHAAYRALDPPRVQAAAQELEETAAVVEAARDALEGVLTGAAPNGQSPASASRSA
jgi:hypothetical protein